MQEQVSFLEISLFPLAPQSSSVVFAMSVVVFVAVHNAAYRLPCGYDSISCYNVICLCPVLSPFVWDLWKKQSSMSSEVRVFMLIQFLVLWCIYSKYTLSGPFLLLHNWVADVALMLAKMGLGQAEQHCTCTLHNGQLFVLHCAADYQAGKSSCEPKSNGQTANLVELLHNSKWMEIPKLAHFWSDQKCQKTWCPLKNNVTCFSDNSWSSHIELATVFLSRDGVYTLCLAQ